MIEPKTVSGKYIRRFRLNTGMSQKRFARAIGISEGAVFKLESGENSPKLDTLWKICKLFLISREEILSGVLGYD